MEEAACRAVGGQSSRVARDPTSLEPKHCGRLYAARPALIGMPKCLLPALVNVDGRPLWEVDYLVLN
jgi:hypothetical protein